MATLHVLSIYIYINIYIYKDPSSDLKLLIILLRKQIADRLHVLEVLEIGVVL